MSNPRMRVVAGTLDQERPWRTPVEAEPLVLVDATSGDAARLRTEVRLFHDGAFLYVVFDFEDDLIVGTMFDRDEPIYEEDVVEVFVAGDRLEEYVEIEISPRGTIFDARVSSPDRDRRTMHVDREWNSEGLWTAVRINGSVDERFRVEVVIAIPKSDISRQSGQWRANFFRVDRHPKGDSYLAWSPSLKEPADFHVPDTFGWLDFE